MCKLIFYWPNDQMEKSEKSFLIPWCELLKSDIVTVNLDCQVYLSKKYLERLFHCQNTNLTSSSWLKGLQEMGLQLAEAAVCLEGCDFPGLLCSVLWLLWGDYPLHPVSLCDVFASPQPKAVDPAECEPNPWNCGAK